MPGGGRGDDAAELHHHGDDTEEDEGAGVDVIHVLGDGRVDGKVHPACLHRVAQQGDQAPEGEQRLGAHVEPAAYPLCHATTPEKVGDPGK